MKLDMLAGKLLLPYKWFNLNKHRNNNQKINIIKLIILLLMI